MNICEHLTVTARLFPDREAITFEGMSLTYAQLDQLSDEASQRLIDAGIRPGDRVALMLPNVPAFVVWYFASLRIGAVAVSISTRLTASEVAFLIDDCQAKAFVTTISNLETLRPTLPPCVAATFSTTELGDQCDGQSLNRDHASPLTWVETEANDAAVILYTSGTTGFAKGATLSHLERALKRACIQSPLQHENGRSNSTFSSVVSLFRSKRPAEFRIQRGSHAGFTKTV